MSMETAWKQSGSPAVSALIIGWLNRGAAEGGCKSCGESRGRQLGDVLRGRPAGRPARQLRCVVRGHLWRCLQDTLRHARPHCALCKGINPSAFSAPREFMLPRWGLALLDWQALGRLAERRQAGRRWATAPLRASASRTGAATAREPPQATRWHLCWATGARRRTTAGDAICMETAAVGDSA